jgi:hypothetical protein
MGLFDNAKGWLIRRAAEKEGRSMAEQSGAVNAFLQVHKTVVAALFLGACGWAWARGCAGVFGVDIASLAHLSCGQFQFGLGVVGAFLLGAGVIQPDEFMKAKTPKVE